MTILAYLYLTITTGVLYVMLEPVIVDTKPEPYTIPLVPVDTPEKLEKLPFIPTINCKEPVLMLNGLVVIYFVLSNNNNSTSVCSLKFINTTIQEHLR